MNRKDMRRLVGEPVSRPILRPVALPKRGETIRCPNSHLIGTLQSDMLPMMQREQLKIAYRDGLDFPPDSEATCPDCGETWLPLVDGRIDATAVQCQAAQADHRP